MHQPNSSRSGNNWKLKTNQLTDQTLKWLLISFLLTCAGFVSAQVKVQVECDYSKRIHNLNFQNNYALGAGLCFNHFQTKITFGMEKWYVDPSDWLHQENKSILYQKLTALKGEAWIGFTLPISQSNFSFGLDCGQRFYLNHQIEETIVLYQYHGRPKFTDNLLLSSNNREFLTNFSSPYTTLADYAKVTKMRTAFLFKVHIGYRYKNFGLKINYIPYFIRFQYQNAADPTKTGSNYLLFHDVGIGLSYTFSCKPKKQA